MLAFPAPTISHSLAGFPSFEFSHTIALAAGGVQGANGSGSCAAKLAKFAYLIPGGSPVKTAFVKFVDGKGPAMALVWGRTDAVLIWPGLPEAWYSMTRITELTTITVVRTHRQIKR